VKTSLVTAPSIEPVTLLTVKNHLRIDSTTFADAVTTVQSISPGDHAVASNYSLVGTGVDVSNHDAVVNLVSGTNGSGGTVDVKIQESDDDSTYTDWTGGAFDQVTEANDNATYEKEYTGTKQYIRAVATVATATCDFGVSVLKYAPTTAEDTLLTRLISAARNVVEQVILKRSLITQTWGYYLDEWPDVDYIELPYPPLQSVSSIKYTDSDDNETTLSTDDYDVDTVSEPGRVKLKYGKSWPSVTLRPMNPICLEYVSGYGDERSDIPEPIIQAILIIIGDLYEHREDTIIGISAQNIGVAEALLNSYRIWSI